MSSSQGAALLSSAAAKRGASGVSQPLSSSSAAGCSRLSGSTRARWTGAAAGAAAALFGPSERCDSPLCCGAGCPACPCASYNACCHRWAPQTKHSHCGVIRDAADIPLPIHSEALARFTRNAMRYSRQGCACTACPSHKKQPTPKPPMNDRSVTLQAQDQRPMPEPSP